MASRGPALRRLVLHTLETLLFVPVLAVMYWLDLAGRAPLWLLIALMVCVGFVQVPRAQLWLSGGDLHRRVVPRLALHFGLVAMIMYLLGWGSIFGVGFILVAAMNINITGPVVWRPAMWLTLGCVAAGEAAVATGLVFTYLPQTGAHVGAVVSGLSAALAIRALGIAAERREVAEAGARAGEERFRALVQDSDDVVAILDPDGRIKYVSPAVTRVAGRHPEELLGTVLDQWIHPDDIARTDGVMAAVAGEPGQQRATELRGRHPDGDWRWYEMTVRNLIDHPVVGGLVITCRDITERRAIQERLAYDARHDALTGLVNRATFMRELETAVADARLTAHGVAVLFLDLDGFKHVNDTLGHEAGDALIVNVAAALRRGVLGSDVVARLGGDEFAVLLAGIDAPNHAVVVAKRILSEMDHPMWYSGQKVCPRSSVGIAVLNPADPETADIDADKLLHRADVAMYAAKRRRTHGYQVYSDALADPHRDLVATDEMLRDAIHEGQMRLQYQPIVSLDSGELTGVEALVRWAHPSRGLLGPNLFIPLAEETGVIGELGEWVLEQACRQVRTWQRLIPPTRRLELSVNVSPLQLARDDLVDHVRDILRRTDFDPRNLVLEVTENALAEDDTAVPQLTALNALGIRIALDDFGTGYSSLKYLTRLPVDILKIDRCFVAELNGTSGSSVIAEAVVRLARILHLDTVAEGIEDEAQANELTLLGCRTGQGYHFARPLDAEAVTSLIEDAAQHWPTLAHPTSGPAVAVGRAPAGTT